jgi:hypothetical protein
LHRPPALARAVPRTADNVARPAFRSSEFPKFFDGPKQKGETQVESGIPVADNPGKAIFHAAKLLQLYEETESVEAVTKLAAALLLERPAEHVREVAWFLPPELIQVLPKQHRARIVPLRPRHDPSSRAEDAARPPAPLEAPLERTVASQLG